MDIVTALERARNGSAVLFCGAGFSADCLDFGGIQIGTGYPLLKLMNSELGFEYSDHKLAAVDYVEKFGNFGKQGLMSLLKSRYAVTEIPASIVSILSFPWERIYTTNYDNAISLGLHSQKKKHFVRNNLDDPTKVGLGAELSVVHLHGRAESWDLSNFEESCILSTQSTTEPIQLVFGMESLRRHSIEALHLSLSDSLPVIFISIEYFTMLKRLVTRCSSLTPIPAQTIASCLLRKGSLGLH